MKRFKEVRTPRTQAAFLRYHDPVNRELDDDRKFFRKNPKRTLRLRPAFTAEAALVVSVHNIPKPPGYKRFVLVHRPAEVPARVGLRNRHHLVLPADTPLDLPEAELRRIFGARLDGSCTTSWAENHWYRHPRDDPKDGE